MTRTAAESTSASTAGPASATIPETVPGPVHRLWPDADRGTVTAEFAVVLPVVMVMALVLFSSARAVVVNMNCQEAARVAAREMVVHGDDGNADPAGVAARIAGANASVAVSVSDDRIAVIARCPVMPGPLGILPVAVQGEAVGIRHE